MDCEEMIEEKEKSGWLGGQYAEPGFIFMEWGNILFRKPDDSPARKFQLFLVEREGKMKQITKGKEEVTEIIYANFRCKFVLCWDKYTSNHQHGKGDV